MSSHLGNNERVDRNVLVGLTFVELMFAVAVGDTAAQIAKVVKAIDQSGLPIQESLWIVSTSFAHLTLAVLVIATSWVGWSHSDATKRYMANLEGIFQESLGFVPSFSFLMLLIDVFLVVCYFILSETAEMPPSDLSKIALAVAPSVGQEISWIFVIMVTYFVWNILFAIYEQVQDGKRLLANPRYTRILLAAMCCALVVLISYLQPTDLSRASALWIDGALLAAVLMFRARLVRKKERKEEKEKPKPEDVDWVWSGGGIVCCIILFLGALAMIAAGRMTAAQP